MNELSESRCIALTVATGLTCVLGWQLYSAYHFATLIHQLYSGVLEHINEALDSWLHQILLYFSTCFVIVLAVGFAVRLVAYVLFSSVKEWMFFWKQYIQSPTNIQND